MSLIQRSNLFDIDRLFNDARQKAVQSQEATLFSPRVDIRDAGDHYEITAELPGVKKEAISVHVKDGNLTLEASSERVSDEEKEGRILRSERRYGKFVRSFNLGADVSEDAIEATFVDGVLTLKAPKVVEQEVLRRQIDIH